MEQNDLDRINSEIEPETESPIALEAEAVDYDPGTAEQEYDPSPAPAEPIAEPVITPVTKKMDWSFLKSTRFWFIGIASVATIVSSPTFPEMSIVQILGHIFQLWATGAAGVGLLDRTVDKITG